MRVAGPPHLQVLLEEWQLLHLLYSYPLNSQWVAHRLCF